LSGAAGAPAGPAGAPPTVGAIEADEFLVCFEARATPHMAGKWLGQLRAITDKPVRYLVLSHYHAVRTLGAAAFEPEVVVAHENTRAMIAERGKEDWDSEAARMPRLFEGAETIPGLTWPDLTFSDRLTIDLGERRGPLVLQYCGRGHTDGDIVAWLPRPQVLFTGDLVESEAALYTGDAFHAEWSTSTLDRVAAFGAQLLVGGRGAPARGPDRVAAAIGQTRGFLLVLRHEVGAVHDRGGTLPEAFDAAHHALAPQYGAWPIFEHCLPFDVSRLWDELDGIDRPRVWTAARDREVWGQLQR
jgi:glyoxylase-like metal-dependent hydrolase (beta-lactamase superfamily II)